MPAKVISVDISDAVTPVSIAPQDDSLRILVRLKNAVLGWVSLSRRSHSTVEISPERLSNAIIHQSSWKVVERHITKSFRPTWHAPYVPSTEGVSIVVCADSPGTRLQGTLQAIAGLKYPEYEVIVVDSAPVHTATEKLVASKGFQYVRLESGGINAARNLGIQSAQYPIIAFLDASATVDRYWLQQVADSFDRGIMGATGYVAPVNWGEGLLDFVQAHFAAVKNKFARQVFRGIHVEECISAPFGRFGSGTNMAFRRETFSVLGHFDAGFDAKGSGGDTGADDMFYRLLKNDMLLVYEPAMLVWRRNESV